MHSLVVTSSYYDYFNPKVGSLGAVECLDWVLVGKRASALYIRTLLSKLGRCFCMNYRQGPMPSTTSKVVLAVQ